MIAKLTKGRGFRGALEYSLKESKGFLLDTNMGGSTPRALAREFGQIRALRPELTRPVHHASIALPPRESLSDEQWQAVGRAYLEGMGFTNNQYVVVRHTDTAHPHIHILVNRITLDGKLISDSKDYYQQEQIMRQLEKEYGLTQVTPSKDSVRRSHTKGEMECALRTGKPSVKMVLQKMVDTALKDAPALAEFSARLEASGVRVIPNQASTGRISGISFQYDGITMKGGDLGRGYTWAGLQKRGLYEQIRQNGRDEGRGDTQAGSSHAGSAGTRAPADTARPTPGGTGPRTGTTLAGSVQPKQQHHAGYRQAAGGMPDHTHDRPATSQQNGRSGESDNGCYPEHAPHPGGGTERRSISAGGVQGLTGAYAENAGAGRCVALDIPTGNSGTGESALGRIAALAAAGLRNHNAEPGADMAKAGGHERSPGGGQERGRTEAVAPPRRRNREERER